MKVRAEQKQLMKKKREKAREKKINTNQTLKTF